MVIFLKPRTAPRRTHLGVHEECALPRSLPSRAQVDAGAGRRLETVAVAHASHYPAAERGAKLLIALF